MSEYNLEKTTKLVGQLYPNLVTKEGRVIDGLHRLKSNPNWKTEVLEQIDTEDKFWTARIVANTRRDVPFAERKRWFNELAEIYLKEGIKSDGSIVKKVVDVTGYAYRTVANYLDKQYKMSARVTKFAVSKATKPFTSIDKAKKKLGSDYKEVEAEIEKNLRLNIEEETREKLSKDPDFIIETIEKAPITLSMLPDPVVTRDGYYKPVITRKQAEEIRVIQRQTEKDLATKRADPKVQERARWVRAWMSLGNILGVIDNVFCPICGSLPEKLVWNCHPEINIYETERKIKLHLDGSS